MTKQAHLQRLAEKRQSKASGKHRARLVGILKRIHREEGGKLKQIWRGESDDSTRWLRET
jgi:hypothetical protein